VQTLQPSADAQRGFGSILVGATVATTPPQSPRGCHPIGHRSDSLGFVNAGVVAVIDKGGGDRRPRSASTQTRDVGDAVVAPWQPARVNCHKCHVTTDCFGPINEGGSWEPLNRWPTSSGRGVFEQPICSPGLHKNEKTGRSVVNDAQRFRAQAELCLQIARLMTDRTAANQLHSKAADYLAQAVELEINPAGPPHNTMPLGGR
jgi:hypothetical protein